MERYLVNLQLAGWIGIKLSYIIQQGPSSGYGYGINEWGCWYAAGWMDGGGKRQEPSNPLADGAKHIFITDFVEFIEHIGLSPSFGQPSAPVSQT